MKLRALFLFIFSLFSAGCLDKCDKTYNPAGPSSNIAEPEEIPGMRLIKGVELSSLRKGCWFAGVYPWHFIPEQSPRHPIPTLFMPGQYQNQTQIQYQEKVLNESGSCVDVLSFNTNGDINHWSANYFPVTRRPLFILYEHIGNSSKNMSDPAQRESFENDIKYMFKNVIDPYESRYVTVKGRAIIYMWATGGMQGDFGSLLEEMKRKYPVFFVGSAEDPNNKARFRAFDGFMDYSLPGYGSTYLGMANGYLNNAVAIRRGIEMTRAETGKKQYLFATFQAAYDDTLVIPRRNPTYSIYPQTPEDMEAHAGSVAAALSSGIFDAGPFVVWSELPEGGCVIPSLVFPEPPDKFVGYGWERLNIVKKYFGG